MKTHKFYDDATITVVSSDELKIPSADKPTASIMEKANTLPDLKLAQQTKSPTYYNNGIECWDYILSHKMGFLEGNIIKYITRYKEKNGKSDLLKAKEYLDKLIIEYEKTKD